MDAKTQSGIVARRLRAQRLTGAPCATPEEAVGLLGAVQAQDYGPAKWSLGARVAGATDAQVERAFASGAILRTHVLRPTWHFVLPADIRWLLTATAPRVTARDARRYAQLGLDGDTLRRSAAALVAALRGGNRLTRHEAAGVLTAAGISVEGQRLPYLLMAAELDALICSGPRSGKQHTHMLLEERAPDARDLPRQEALAELARRFFAGHGPATAKDFAVWATLTLAEARAAIEAAGPELRAEGLGGLLFWAPATGPGSGGGRLAPPRRPRVHLLQGYDEIVMGYSETKPLLARPGSPWVPATPPVFRLVVLLDGGVAGFWRPRPQRHGVTIEVAPMEAFGGAAVAALEAEAARYGAFLGLPAETRMVESRRAG
ncbi:MAG: winged helix DNA-binding domain-containing protein [Deltaproteobacteria bacterium]